MKRKSLSFFLGTSSDCVPCEPVDGAVFHRSPTHPSIISAQWVHCFHILSYLLYPRSPTVHFCDSSLPPFLSLSVCLTRFVPLSAFSRSLSRIHPSVRAVPIMPSAGTRGGGRWRKTEVQRRWEGRRHIYTNTQFPKHSWGLTRAKKSLFPGTPNPWVRAKDHNLCAQLTPATRDTLGFF